MKLKIEEILDKIEELDDNQTMDFIFSLDVTPKQMDILANHEKWYVKFGLAKNPKITEKIMIKLDSDENVHVRWGLTKNPNLTEKIMIQLASDNSSFVSYDAFKKLKKLNSLKKEELEEAYDLIMKSKYISRKHFEMLFEYIAYKFPELSKLARIYKKLILKLKKDLK